MLSPIFAEAGLKAPVTPLVIPVPDQVPPTGDPTKVTQGSDSQNGPKAVIVGVT